MGNRNEERTERFTHSDEPCEEKTNGGKCGRIAQASLTVETALLMPIAIFVIIMAVYLTAHVHNRAYLASDAAEQAVSGHEKETASLFASGEVQCIKSDDRNRRTVKNIAETKHFSGKTLWSVEEEAVYKKYRPVEFIRKTKSVRNLLGGSG